MNDTVKPNPSAMPSPEAVDLKRGMLTPEQAQLLARAAQTAIGMGALGHNLRLFVLEAGRVTAAGTETLRQFGRRIVGRPFLDLVDPEDHPRIRDMLERDEDDGDDGDVQTAFLLPLDGLRTLMQLRKRRQGAETYIYALDETDRTLHGERESRRSRHLAASLEEAGIGEWTFYTRSREIVWSPQMYRMAELDPARFVPTPGSWLSLVHPEDRAEVATRMDSAGGQEGRFAAHFRSLLPSGRLGYFRAAGRGLRMAETGEVVIRGIVQDVTAQIEAEHAAAQALARAEEANAAKIRFLASIGHELRTPLNAILGFSDLIGHQLMGPLGHPAYAEHAQLIHEAGQHLLDLVNDVLDMARIETGHVSIRREKVDVAVVAELAYRLLADRARQGEIDLHMAVQPAMPPLALDRRALRQMLINLMSNAITYSPQGGRVMANLGIEAGQLKIEVADTGYGIAPEEMERVLRPFERGAQAGRLHDEGSGLGLAIVRGLAEAHGGGLAIVSTLGIGTKVTVTLPLAAEGGATPTPPDIAADNDAARFEADPAA